MALRKIDLMHKHFGKCDGHTCSECSNLWAGYFGGKIRYKCRVYGPTLSKESDWAKRWLACGMFNKDYHGRLMIELVERKKASTVPEEPLEGQMMMEDSQ